MNIDKYKQPDGTYFFDGLTYESAEDVLGEMIGFCGCGNPFEALKYTATVLQFIKDCRTSDTFKDIFEIFPSEGLGYFVLYTLDHFKLTEHGGSVGGSWLSEKGQMLLDDINELQEEITNA
jgi:hypothetical protein